MFNLDYLAYKEEYLVKSIGILGVGQAGGNIAEIAAAMNFPTALINTNQRDGIVNTRVEKKFFFPGL